MDTLAGRVALVTGGGRGIGRGIVARFLEAGARVVIAQRSDVDDDLQSDPRVAYVAADLAAADLAPIVDRSLACFGRIDVLVNNAGLMDEQPLAEITPASWDRTMHLNVRTPMLLAQAAAPLLGRHPGGSIINIGSIEGAQTGLHHVAYTTSKAAVAGLTTALAVELGPVGVRCNAIAPGWIDTDLSDRYLAENGDPATARDALLALHPLRRTGSPLDVGGLAVYLASEAAAFMTGQTITIDGGRTARLSVPFATG